MLITISEQFDKWLDTAGSWVLTHGIRIAIILAGMFILGKLARKFLARAVKAALVSDKFSSKIAEQKRTDTLVRIFTVAVRLLIVIIGVLMLLQEIGLQIGPLLAGLGVAGLAVGFGGQYLIRDVISGLFIILENQYRIGDVVDFDGTGGLVEDISLRMTTIRDLDGTVHHIPHGEIKRVSNLSKYFSRVNLNVGVAYRSDLEHVISVVNRIGNEMATDPKWKDAITKPPQFLRVDDFADSSIVIKILGETQPIRQWDVTGELRMRIKIAFDKEGIEIPFPQRVIYHVQTPEAVG